MKLSALYVKTLFGIKPGLPKSVNTQQSIQNGKSEVNLLSGYKDAVDILVEDSKAVFFVRDFLGEKRNRYDADQDQDCLRQKIQQGIAR